MNKLLRYGGGGMLLVLWLLAGCRNDNAGNGKLPSLTETYTKEDKNPFGGYIAYQMMTQMYRQAGVKVKKESFEKTWAKIYDTGALYVILAPRCLASEQDVDAMMAYVKAGNDLFISAAGFSDALLNKIGVRLNRTEDWLNIVASKMGEAVTRLHPGQVPDSSRYSYYYLPFSSGFTGLPPGESRIVGYNKSGAINSFVYFYGKGKLFLHCEPRALSNYFLLQKDNYQYLRHLLGLSRPQPESVYWNDYYHRSRDGSTSGGRRTGSNKGAGSRGSTFDGLNGSLLTAFLLVLFLLLLYILNGVKRRQRIIPVRKPNENTSVTFTETVGLLYLQKKDNKNIAEKMITYFNEFVRNQYFLNTSQVNEAFLSALSRKSGVQQEKVTALYEAIALAQGRVTIDDLQLLALNQHIQNFYKNRN